MHVHGSARNGARPLASLSVVTVTSAPEGRTASPDAPTVLRRIAGVVSLAASATVFAALVTQITD